MTSGWGSARREVAVAAILAAALAAAAWAIVGPAAAALVVLISVAVSLVAMQALIGRGEEPGPPLMPDSHGSAQSFRGFWRAQVELGDATKSLSAWDYRTRPRLTNLLAARLAERHGISLADEPDQARRLLLRRPSRHDLWYWIDPQRETPPDASSRRGISASALAALIDRLEQL